MILRNMTPTRTRRDPGWLPIVSLKLLRLPVGLDLVLVISVYERTGNLESHGVEHPLGNGSEGSHAIISDYLLVKVLIVEIERLQDLHQSLAGHLLLIVPKAVVTLRLLVPLFQGRDRYNNIITTVVVPRLTRVVRPIGRMPLGVKIPCRQRRESPRHVLQYRRQCRGPCLAGTEVQAELERIRLGVAVAWSQDIANRHLPHRLQSDLWAAAQPSLHDLVRHPVGCAELKDVGPVEEGECLWSQSRADLGDGWSERDSANNSGRASLSFSSDPRVATARCVGTCLDVGFSFLLARGMALECALFSCFAVLAVELLGSEELAGVELGVRGYGKLPDVVPQLSREARKSLSDVVFRPAATGTRRHCSSLRTHGARLRHLVVLRFSGGLVKGTKARGRGRLRCDRC